MANTFLRFGVFTFCLGVAALHPDASQAASFVFDFEDQPLGGEVESQFTSRTIINSALTATITRSSGKGFSFANLNTVPIAGGGVAPCSPTIGSIGCPPANWADRTLSPFSAPAESDYFIFQLNQSVASIGIEAGDRNVDADELRLEAYDGPNGTGNLLGTAVASYSIPDAIPDDIITLGLDKNLISSFRLYGGSRPDPSSMFWDNLTVRTADQPPTSVPSPLPVVGAGMAFAYSRRLRKRIKNA